MEGPHAHHNEGVFANHPWLRNIAIGTALVTGAVILSPYILPMFGAGNAALGEEAMLAMHGSGLGNGLAGAINSGLNAVPLIGPILAEGGLLTAVASGVIGIGGTFLGNQLDNKQGDKKGIRWGKIIRTAALATSALIALPSLLTSISVGIVYLCAAFSGTALASSAVAFLSSTIGSVGGMSATATGVAGAFAALPHLLTCGAPLLPAVISFGMGGNAPNDHKDDVDNPSAPQLHFAPSIWNSKKYSDGTIIAEMGIEPLAINRPCVARLRLTHQSTGQPITPDELAVVHTKKLHLFVADSRLKDYHHIHPQPTGEPGVLAFSFTPKTNNDYSAWADFTMVSDNKNHKIKMEMPAATGVFIAPRVHVNSRAKQAGLSFEWKSNTPLRKDTPSIVDITVTDARGNPVTDLEPVMGAFAHLVGFSADGKSLIHTHPMGAEPTEDHERGGPALRFHIEPGTAGATQFYLHIKRNGQEAYIPFGQQIKPPELTSEMVSMGHHGMSLGHAM